MRETFQPGDRVVSLQSGLTGTVVPLPDTCHDPDFYTAVNWDGRLGSVCWTSHLRRLHDDPAPEPPREPAD